jgi:peroxiredoxin
LLVVGLTTLGAGAYVALTRTPGPIRSGAPAPGFALPSLNGAPIALESYRGRVVFVNFWATWCAPCKEEAPALQRLRSQLRDEGFEVLAISIDSVEDRSAVAAFGADLGLDFPLLVDPEKRVYAAYQVYGVPETFLIDPMGRIAERFVGPKPWDDPRYERAIRRLLEGPGDG